MNQETVTYLTNIVIGVILAVLTTHFWRQRGHAGVQAYWVVGAWVMTAADILFASRTWLPHAFGRLAPTLGVTLGHSVLLSGAQLTAALPLKRRWLAVVFALHAAGLVVFLQVPSLSGFRMVFNGAVWGGLSIASGLLLRRGADHFWKPIFSPANVFFAHAAFHALRITLALSFVELGWKQATSTLQIAGDLEVSFFMVALFVGLLIAHLQIRHDELMHARVEMETLEGLLPICAWCKKVRDDDGYWRQVEEYFSRHSRLKFTHGMCSECFDDLKQQTPEPLPQP